MRRRYSKRRSFKRRKRSYKTKSTRGIRIGWRL